MRFSPSSTLQAQFSSTKDKQLGWSRKLHPRGNAKQNNYMCFWTHPPAWGIPTSKKTMSTEEICVKPRPFDCLRVGRPSEVQPWLDTSPPEFSIQPKEQLSHFFSGLSDPTCPWWDLWDRHGVSWQQHYLLQQCDISTKIRWALHDSLDRAPGENRTTAQCLGKMKGQVQGRWGLEALGFRALTHACRWI